MKSKSANRAGAFTRTHNDRTHRRAHAERNHAAEHEIVAACAGFRFAFEPVAGFAASDFHGQNIHVSQTMAAHMHRFTVKAARVPK